MRRLMMLLAPLAVLLGAGTAMACVVIDMGFDPEVATYGDRVTFHASIANNTGDDVVADFELTISVADFTLGPFNASLPLPKGLGLSTEFGFTVPPLPVEGTLSICVTVEAAGHTDTAEATLTITAGGDGELDAAELQVIGDGILNSFDHATPAEEMTLGAVKALYR